MFSPIEVFIIGLGAFSAGGAIGIGFAAFADYVSRRVIERSGKIVDIAMLNSLEDDWS